MARGSIFFIFSVGALILASCAYEIEKEGDERDLSQFEVIGFDTLSTEVFGSRCALSGCHDGLQLPDLLDYESVLSYGREIYDRAVIKRDMPPPPRPGLTEEEYAILKRWFAEGKQRQSK